MTGSRSLYGLSTATVLLWTGLSGAAVQQDVEIDLGSIRCWPTDQFLVVRPTFQPPADIQTAKFYFRSVDHPDYYFVEMTVSPQGTGRVIVPKAEPQTSGVAFYAELVTRGYSAFRTEEMTVPVSSGSECRRQNPDAAFYTGPNPDISLGATHAGPQLAPGFQADGITRFISSTGISGEAAGGGGISGKTLALIGGGGGAAALAFLSGGSKDNTESGIGGNTTVTTTAGSTTTAISGGGGPTTTTVGGGGGSNSTTTVFGSTTTVGGATTTVPGGSTSSVFGGSTTTIGSSTTTIATTTIPSSTTTAGTTSTTSISSTTTSVASTSSVASSTATTTAAAGADMRFDSISDSPDPVVTGGLVSYTFVVTNLGPATAPSVLISVSMSKNDCPKGGLNCSAGGCGFGQCSLGSLGPGKSAQATMRIQLNGAGTHTIDGLVGGGTTDPNTANNRQSEKTNVTATLRTSEDAAPVAKLLSTLDVRPLDGRVRARITLNDAVSEETSNTGPRIHTLAAQRGENRAEVQVDLGKADSGTWRLDFSGTRDFVPNSLRIQAGQVLTQDQSSVTFAVGGGTTVFRFTFELSEATP